MYRMVPLCSAPGGHQTGSRPPRFDNVSLEGWTLEGRSGDRRRQRGGRGTRRAVGVDRLLAWKDVFSDTWRQGRGMFHPPPRQPLPHGGDSPSIHCRGDEHQPPSRWIPRQDSVSVPCTAIRGYRHSLPAPWRGREEARNAPGGGGDRLLAWKDVFSGTPRQGRGMFHPPPRQPLPGGVIPCRYSATGEISFSWFQARNSPKFLLPRTRPPSQSPFTARPLEGAGGGAERAGRWGLIDVNRSR